MSRVTTMEGSRKSWLRRLGWAGFLFFLVKGLVWLAIFLGAGKMLGL